MYSLDRTASAMASVAILVVLKQGKADGSLWDIGMTVLLSDGLRFDMSKVRAPLMVVVSSSTYTPVFPLNPHFLLVNFEQFSMTL